MEFVDFRVQLVPYETRPLWRIKQEICNCLNVGTSAIILPEQYEGHLAAAAIVQSISDNTNVPCVSLHLTPPTRPSTHLHPHLNAKSLAVAAFIKREKWKDVVVVFEDPEELLEVTDMITAGHFDPDSFSSQLVRLKHGDDYGNELKHIKNKLDRYRIVINIPLYRALRFLEQAANMSMCGVLYHYVVMDMDLVTVDIDNIREIEDCNITSFGVHDVNSEHIEEVRHEIAHKSSIRLPKKGVPKIANILKFSYTIQKVRDNAYGSKESNGKWSGMVGELQRGDADLAVASLTISYGRSEVIDFTVPYMHLGISILFKKPRITDSDWFKFMDPLSTQVWIMTFASYFVVSIAIWIIAKISPYEQFERDEDNGQYKPVNNQFSIRNAFWFTVCSLMQQGSELCPRAASTRLITAIWWFFALILISSYTANLAAVLTTRRMETPIENADDLAAQTKIKYGTLGRGSTMSFFNESKIETYERMWQLMSTSPGLFVHSSKEGIARVKSSDYAYLMESSMLEYAVERDCELMQIGGLIDQKGYGIGLPKGSPYRELISTAILRLQEKTELTELKEKWWKDKSTVCEQPKRKDQDDGESIGGIFIILVVGLFFTAILVIFEMITTRKRTPAQSEVIRHVNVIPTFKFEFFK
uniref:Uncharacterized protein n=1 Tax=Caenorhabditis japonica TaxID=281687 RepID=A0A8R1HVC7_CAEJA